MITSTINENFFIITNASRNSMTKFLGTTQILHKLWGNRIIFFLLIFFVQMTMCQAKVLESIHTIRITYFVNENRTYWTKTLFGSDFNNFWSTKILQQLSADGRSGRDTTTKTKYIEREKILSVSLSQSHHFLLFFWFYCTLKL